MSVSRKCSSTSLHANIKLDEFILALAPIILVFLLVSLMLFNDHIHSFIKSSGLLKTDAHISPWIVHGRRKNTLMIFYFLSFHEFPLIYFPCKVSSWPDYALLLLSPMHLLVLHYFWCNHWLQDLIFLSGCQLPVLYLTLQLHCYNIDFLHFKF